ncbi:MAG: DUF1801 domain-containing protein, partial [Clostridia bacterium]|nr:DUF1801 domain-containing protein [Clostridia bacterium]
MDARIKERLDRCPQEVVQLYLEIRRLLLEGAPGGIEERMWAGMPSYAAGERFVRLIPFRDHVNIEASAVVRHREKLAGYAVTPKGMLQVYAGQEIPDAALREIFAETLEEQKPL